MDEMEARKLDFKKHEKIGMYLIRSNTYNI